MSQLGLLSWTPPEAAPSASEQAQNLARVEGRLGEFILAWCALREGREFHLCELERDVSENLGGSHASVSRILRLLRQAGQVSYVVVNRAKSLYRIDGVRP